ncbi:MAG: hypothetical protein ACI9IP_000724 [Arcticibacterium sp.]|jgi:hypothetical protein
MKLIVLSLILWFYSCTPGKDKLVPSNGEEQVYKNGKFYTVNDANPSAEVMIIRDGIIVAIGTNQEIEN